MAAPADSLDDRFCRAIDLARFKKALAAATGHAALGSERWALAVSGGADSMALLRLAAAAAEGARDRLLVLTVDHGLRAAAAAEARQVAAWCAGLGVPHEVLTVRENPPAAGLQAWARRQRYERLLQRCRDENIAHLLLGHQRQDQAETVFHRFYSERPKSETFGNHSGLGLSIAKQIIEGHGGSLVASNRDTGGACFALTLPLA